MMSTSVRARVLAGAALWSLGLFTASMLISTAIMLRHRQFAFLLHGVAEAHAGVFTVLLVGFMAAGFLLVRRALAPLAALRVRLASVRAGASHRIQGSYPSEVQPLVDDLNALLEHQEQAVRRAVAKAGDLAHGLKTPLAVLTQESERAGAAGHHDLARTLAEQVAGMRRQVDYHLAHARAAASGATPGASCPVAESVAGLVRTLERLHAGRSIRMQVDVHPAHHVRAQRQDLDEMLGNLLDNAWKWARSRIGVSSTLQGGSVVVTVDDDGPGVAVEMRDAVLQRGVRVDEAAPGSGFGLAIVRELVELYGGAVALEDAPGGGLRVRLTLPASRQRQ